MRNLKQNLQRNQNTHLSSIFFFENHVVYEIMWKNVIHPERSHMTIKYGECALHIAELSLQIHTDNM